MFTTAICIKYMVHNSCANHNGSDSTVLMSCESCDILCAMMALFQACTKDKSLIM